MNATQVAVTIEGLVGEDVFAALGAHTRVAWNDPDTPGLQFDTDGGARVTITLEYGGTYTVNAADPCRMETKFRRTGVEYTLLADVVSQIPTKTDEEC